MPGLLRKKKILRCLKTGLENPPIVSLTLRRGSFVMLSLHATVTLIRYLLSPSKLF